MRGSSADGRTADEDPGAGDRLAGIVSDDALKGGIGRDGGLADGGAGGRFHLNGLDASVCNGDDELGGLVVRDHHTLCGAGGAPGEVQSPRPGGELQREGAVGVGGRPRRCAVDRH